MGTATVPPTPGRDRTRAGARASFSSALPYVLLVTGVFFLNFVARVAMAPLLPAVERDLGLAHAEAGSLFLLISLGYCAGLLGSGFLSARVGHRRTVVLSSTVVGGALLGAALGEGVPALWVGMALLGAGAGLYLPSGIATVTDLVSPGDWGKALAAHELAPNVSFVTAPLLAEAFLRWLPWRGALAAFGVAALVGAAGFARFGKGGDFPGTVPGPRAVRQALGQPPLWTLMGLFSLALGASIGVYSMLPLYLVSGAGMERATANTLVALSRIPGLAMVFGAGWLSDRLGPRRAITLILTGAGLLTALIGIASGAWLAAAVFLQPLLAVCFFPVGFAALSRLGPLAVSLAVPPAILLGAGGIPALTGVMASLGHFRGGLVLVGGLILAGAGLARLLPLPGEADGRGDG